MKKKAEKRTGLAWLQIYKWFFDKQMRIDAAKAECECYTVFKGQIFSITRNGKELNPPVQVFDIIRDKSYRRKAAKNQAF